MIHFCLKLDTWGADETHFIDRGPNRIPRCRHCGQFGKPVVEPHPAS